MVCWLSCMYMVVWVVLLEHGFVEAGYEKTCSPERRREGPVSRSHCGSQLSNILSLVCDGRFSMFKRSGAPYPGGLKDILANKRDALDYLGKRDNYFDRKGVVCECCYHSCNYSEMREYCEKEKKRSPDDDRNKISSKSGDSPSLNAIEW